MKKVKMVVCSLFTIALNCYAGHTEYYTDENGWSQSRWVSDEKESNTNGYGDKSSGSNNNGYAQGARDTIQEATNMMSGNGKAVWDKIGNAVSR